MVILIINLNSLLLKNLSSNFKLIFANFLIKESPFQVINKKLS